MPRFHQVPTASKGPQEVRKGREPGQVPAEPTDRVSTLLPQKDTLRNLWQPCGPSTGSRPRREDTGHALIILGRRCRLEPYPPTT